MKTASLCAAVFAFGLTGSAWAQAIVSLSGSSAAIPRGAPMTIIKASDGGTICICRFRAPAATALPAGTYTCEGASDGLQTQTLAGATLTAGGRLPQ